jgi:hypothetical protein
MTLFCKLILSGAALVAMFEMAMAAPTSDQQPLYIYLSADISDHVNLDITEERLRRVLPMLDRYRKAHPNSSITATVLFSGAVSQALAERNSQTHILDLVQDFIRRGVIEVGYDGFSEPTYATRPLVQLRNANTPEQRWQARADTAEKFLTEARNPLTGAPEPGKDGGLKRMQEVFGDAVYITGLTLYGADPMVQVIPEVGTDTETMYRLRQYNSKAVLSGLLDSAQLETTRYRGWAETFSKEMSPVPATPPELYWQDNVLRFSESTGVENRMLRASAGPDALKNALAKMNRSRIRLVRVDLGSDRDYLTPRFSRGESYPPVRFAYHHPDQPQLPAEALRSTADIDKAYANADATLKWLTEELLPGDSGVHFLSTAQLKRMVKPDTNFGVRVNALRSATEQMLAAWADKPAPPKYLPVEDHYLSRAEMFQAMADALARRDTSHKFPKSVRIVPVVAPIEVPRDKPATGEVSASAVAHAAAGFAARLHDQTGDPIPNNVIPTKVNVEGIDVSPAQFLRLMAEALVAPSPQAKLQIKPEDMFSGIDELYYKTRVIRDMGGLWTRKPAVLASAPSSRGETARTR